jgi:hypothetical protein
MWEDEWVLGEEERERERERERKKNRVRTRPIVRSVNRVLYFYFFNYN